MKRCLSGLKIPGGEIRLLFSSKSDMFTLAGVMSDSESSSQPPVFGAEPLGDFNLH